MNKSFVGSRGGFSKEPLAAGGILEESKMLAKLFEEQVKKHPHRVAIRAGEGYITYAEINRQANRIARHIEGNGAGSGPGVEGGGQVGLLFDHGPAMIAAIIGVLKAGRVYVPLSPDYPRNRIAYMVKDSEATILLTQPQHEDIARVLARETGIEVMVLHRETGPAEDNPRRQPRNRELAYIMYTSGSTGRPKGVMQSHENVLYYTRNWVERFSITGADRMTLFSSFCHDGSVQDMFSALHSGAVLYPFDMKRREGSMELSRYLTRERITIWHSVPSLYSFFAGTLTGEEQFKDLRYILLGGEPVREHEIILLREHFPYSILVNIYGQTESSVNSTWQVAPRDKYERLLIGEPLDRTQVYVIDEAGNPVEPLETGEILVVCDHVSPGYWKNPGATEAAFGEEEGFGKLYWTGDLGCMLPGGGIEFLGRKDYQVKIRGYRIEPAEIETQLLKYPTVKEAVVTAREDESGDKNLCAYMVARTGEPGKDEAESIGKLREFLSGELPDYMIPTYFIYLDAFPLTQSGKIDRKALPAPQHKKGGEYTGPRDRVERKLEDLWAELLVLDKELIGIDSNFFSLGGHSLKATALVSRLHKYLKVKMPLAQVFKTPTIRGQAEYIKKAVTARYAAIPVAEKKEYYDLSSAQKRLYVLQHMQSENTGYNMPRVIPFTSALSAQVLKEKLEQVFRGLIARHESLRTSFHLEGGRPVQRVHDETEFNLTTDYTDYTDKNYKIQNTNYQQIPNYNDQNDKQKGSPSGILITPSAKTSLENGQGRGYCPGRGEVSSPSPLPSPLPSPSPLPLPNGVEKNIRDFIRPFDLSEAPLLRVILSEAAEQRYRLFIDMHHIITDAASQEVLTREFGMLFEGKSLSPLKLQYRDYAEWQNQQEQQRQIKHQEVYWLNTYPSTVGIPVLELPIDKPRPLVRGFEGGVVRFSSGPRESRIIKKLAEEVEGTSFMVILSLFNILLAKLSGQEEIIVGTPIAARRHEDLERIIGMFVNTLALRNYPCGEKTLKELLSEVKQSTLQAFENQEYQFEDLVEKLSLPRDTGRNPLFDVMLNILDRRDYAAMTPGPGEKEETRESLSYTHRQGAAKVDLALVGVEKEDGYLFEVEYSTKLFKASTVDRIIGYFKKILEGVGRGVGQRISHLEIIPEAEKYRVLNEFNETRAEYPGEKTIHELFRRQVEESPDRVALEGPKLQETNHQQIRGALRADVDAIGGTAVPGDDDVRPVQPVQPVQPVRHLALTYRELQERSARIAHELMEKGVGPGAVVAVKMEPSVDMIIGILGILNAGGAYMPIDPGYPEERVKYMLEDSAARILVSDRKDVGTGHCPVLILDIVQAVHGEIGIQTMGTGNDRTLERGYEVKEASANHSVSREMVRRTFLGGGRRPLAYVIYTSGTTGRPKGVMVDHKNVVRLVKENRYLRFSVGDRLMLTGAPAFDITTFEIWGPLLNQAALYLPPKEILLNAEALAALMKKNDISIVHIIPQLLNQLIGRGVDIFSGVKYLLVGGDLVQPPGINAVRAKYKEIKILHMYGPTENTTFSTYHEIDREYTERIPIGKPVGNSTVYILDKYGNHQPCGIVGEIYVGGDGVARGYLNRPELTAERFIVSDRSDRYNRSYIRLYRTGDLARWQSNGDLEYLGRIDNQVKIRGIRIETEEIENRLMTHPQIKEAVVMARNETGGEKYLCAYYVSERAIPVSGIREYLSKGLPVYMIPVFFESIEKIPLTSNGKVDRDALPEPGIKGKDTYTPPTSEIEKKLVGIWAAVLGRDPLQTSQMQAALGIDDHFFERGGHSLKATLLAAGIKREFNLSIPLTEIINRPTIRHQAQYIGAQTREPGEPGEENTPVLLKEGKSSGNHLFFLHDGSGEVEGYMELCNALGTDTHCWGIRAEAENDYAPRNLLIEEMAEKYIRRIRSIQAAGPYSILGWSFGGTLAFEIARQLEQQQEKIEILVLVDVWPPLENPGENGQNPFTPASELNQVKEWLPPGLYEEVREIPRIEQIWKRIVEYLEPDTPGEILESLKKALDRYGGNRMLDYQRLRTRDLIRYLNKYRSFYRARLIYIPTGKIDHPIHYIKATESRITRPEKWREYTHQPLYLYEVKGDHYSIFKRPAVLDFAKKFDQILEKSGRRPHPQKALRAFRNDDL